MITRTETTRVEDAVLHTRGWREESYNYEKTYEEEEEEEDLCIHSFHGLVLKEQQQQYIISERNVVSLWK